MYNGEQYAEGLRTNQFLDKQLSYRTIKDCFVMPYTRVNEGGLFDHAGRYIVRSSWREGGGWLERELQDNSDTSLAELAERQGMNISGAPRKRETVIYAGIFMSAWGHFIMDSMRMLWFLNSDWYREKYRECRIIYLPYHNFELSGSHKRMLEILNIDCSKLEAVRELTQYDEVILPDESFFMDSKGTRLFTSKYTETIDRVRNYALAHAEPTASTKLYYSYSGYRKGKSFGEDKLEGYFASKGYEIVHPENLTLDEQLNKLINCTHFASTIGSCSYNMIFLRDNSEVILIPRLIYLTNSGYHNAVNQVHRQKITHIDSSFSIFATAQWSGPFLYFISSNLRKYFHDEDTESIVDAGDFWKYARFVSGLRFGRSFGKPAGNCLPNICRYYAPVSAEYFSELIKQSWPCRLRQFLKRLLKR